MARARNIKPSFFTNDTLAEMNCPLGRLLFIGMWTLADHNGNLEWRPKKIKIQLLPYDDCDIEQLAINLDKSGFIRFYSNGDKIYVNVTNFEAHQNPHKNEKEKGTDIPEYSAGFRQLIDLQRLTINRDKSGEERNGSASDPADSPFLIPDSCSPIPPPSSDDEGSDQQGETIASDQQKKFRAKNIDLPDSVCRDTWVRWCDFRTSKRKPISEKAAPGQIAMLSEHPPDVQRAIVQQSIDNDYQGLFPPKGASHAASQQPYQPSSAVDRIREANLKRAAEREKTLSGQQNGSTFDERGNLVG